MKRVAKAHRKPSQRSVNQRWTFTAPLVYKQCFQLLKERNNSDIYETAEVIVDKLENILQIRQ
ncbi:hypothetical protein M419DRAFT_118003 [Trichoderma reesei RUT C-30]|uniref:Uncharacterized protein n=1 Tax=Hypocrea jecorina (strain ATCC 56765 / BCRC 32924 / NRRL 11460 / Rut C-30) TaxID=1344414 RepID=A0A024SGI0_HYPJR|nr:hypothetical protein M419DRAFT_118003 [Trichoderma reesei RUT C-30]